MSVEPLGHKRGFIRRLRRGVYHALGGGVRRGPIVRAIDLALVVLIVLNCLVSILESDESIAFLHGPAFHAFDVDSVLVFTVEYVLRVWTAVEMPGTRFRHPVLGRLRYMVTPLALIDLAAVLPFYLGILFEFDLRAVRVLRLLRLLKLTRYSQAMTIMVAVLRQEARAIGAVLFVFVIILVFVSSLMYLIEHEAQPEKFADIPQAMWWAVVTMTTLGYGDIVPVTGLGRILGACTAVIGVGMIALPAGVLASGFSEQMRIRRAEYRDTVETLLHRGTLSRSKRHDLRRLGEELGLPEEEAARILADADASGGTARCPYCGQPLIEVPEEG